ncbi:hypothetical protein SMICM17S_02711 [Streptomyces microflavus]
MRALHPGKARTTTDRLKVYVAPDRYASTPGIRMVMPQRTADRLGLAFRGVRQHLHPQPRADGLSGKGPTRRSSRQATART